MTHYFKRRWNECRGDEFGAWGCSLWLFETDEEFWPMRQIEIYEGGQVLCYDREHPDDEYGGLAEVALDPEEFAEFSITSEEFEHAWSANEPLNRA